MSSSDASTLNFLAGEIVPHFTFAKLSSGDLCVISRVDAHVIVDSFGYVDGDVDRPPPPTTPPTTQPPSTNYFETSPVGATLPSGAECATRVRPTAEIRPANAGPNNVSGTVPNTRSDWWAFQRVDGNFTGRGDDGPGEVHPACDQLPRERRHQRLRLPRRQDAPRTAHLGRSGLPRRLSVTRAAAPRARSGASA